jgi:hypothetical protein
MSDSAAPVPRTFPSRIANLGFTAPLPADWVSHELPGEEPDFSNTTFMFPLAVVTAPHAAIILAVAARPAFADGTLSDWTQFLLQHHGLKPQTLGQHPVGNLPGLIGEAVQESEMGPMKVRFAFIEDGQRLINLTFSAPEMLEAAVRHIWFQILSEFALTDPQGPTVPVYAGGPIGNVAAERPLAGPPPKSAAPTPDPVPVSSPVEPSPVAETPSPASETQPPPDSFAAHALAEDAATLDPENPINANLRNRGVGFTPNVAAIDTAQRRATLNAGAIEAQFDVPFGWHVIDDGRRTLVLEPSGAVQIHLHLLPREDRSDDAIVEAIESDAQSSYPNPEFRRLREGTCFGVAVRNIHDGDQPLSQLHLIIPWREDRLVLRARVTATPERVTAATQLAQLMLGSMIFDPARMRS